LYRISNEISCALMDAVTKETIEAIIASCVSRTVKRVKQEATHRPFHEALLTPALVRASAFERSFSTSFGQGPIEEISAIVALANGCKVQRAKDTEITIQQAKAPAVSDIMADLRNRSSAPNWKKELERVSQAQSRAEVSHRVRSDLWVEKDGKNCYFSIKTVKPNLDQTEIAKKDMLMLKAADPACEVFFALYYNPGGETRADYDWSIPSAIFNMRTDPCVLIGKDYWNFLGGPDAYEELIGIFAKVGVVTRKSLGAA
jgi:hypothetical protein